MFLHNEYTLMVFFEPNELRKVFPEVLSVCQDMMEGLVNHLDTAAYQQQHQRPCWYKQDVCVSAHTSRHHNQVEETFTLITGYGSTDYRLLIMTITKTRHGSPDGRRLSSMDLRHQAKYPHLRLLYSYHGPNVSRAMVQGWNLSFQITRQENTCLPWSRRVVK